MLLLWLPIRRVLPFETQIYLNMGLGFLTLQKHLRFRHDYVLKSFSLYSILPVKEFNFDLLVKSHNMSGLKNIKQYLNM